MSVLVKGMEKPEHCGYCRFRYGGICHALQKTQYSMDECPLAGIDDVPDICVGDTISRQAAMMPYTDYTVRLGDLKRAIMKNPYDPNLNIDGYMRYLKYNTPSAQQDNGYIEQIKWERDLAIRQLADLGYGLGEKPRTNGDLISRKDAIEWVQNILATHLYYHPHSKSRNVPIDEVIDNLDRVPSIEAVPVVRCEDCKWSDEEGRCEVHETLSGNDFCSKGERGEE